MFYNNQEEKEADLIAKITRPFSLYNEEEVAGVSKLSVTMFVGVGVTVSVGGGGVSGGGNIESLSGEEYGAWRDVVSDHQGAVHGEVVRCTIARLKHQIYDSHFSLCLYEQPFQIFIVPGIS